jgi:hypothetical protein
VKSHVLHLLLYSTLVAGFFGALVRRKAAEQLRFAVIIWLVMVGGAVLLGYLMYPFPR